MSAELATRFEVQGTTFIAGPGSDPAVMDSYWADGDWCRAEVDRTDENEIRIGIKLRESDSDDAALYLTDSEAARLGQMLGALVLG